MSTFTFKLRRIDPVKWGIIAGLLYALLSLIIVIPMMLFFSVAGLSSMDDSGGLALFGGGIAMLFAPILYGIIGFIFGLIGALLFNFILKKTGGLDMDFEKAGMDVSQIGQDFLNETNR